MLGGNVTGVVGASYSSNTQLAAYASTMYDIPMISYQSSATSIGDTNFFPYLFRFISVNPSKNEDIRLRLNKCMPK